MTKKASVLWLSVLALACLVLVLVTLLVRRPSQSNAAVVWGVLVPLTGDRAAYGAAMRAGATLAADEINAAGGIAGKPLELIIEDTKSAPRDCVNAFEKLTTQDAVKVVLGPMSSSEVLSVAPLAEKRKVLLFTPSASSPEITSAGDYIFRNVPSDLFEGSLMAEVAASKLNLRSVGILYINNEYGSGVEKTFRGAYEKLGGNIPVVQAYADGTRDFRTQLLKIRESAPEALFIIGYKEMGVAVSQARLLGLTQRFLSTAIFEDPEILATAGRAAEGLIFTSITFDPRSPGKRAENFTRSYRERFKQAPDGYAASTYDAVSILAGAARSAGSTAPSDLKDALYALDSFPGLIGEIAFDSNGDALLPIRLKQVQDGKFVSFTP